MMTFEEIDDGVKTIMLRDGPDRHIDGHTIITDFIIAVREDRGAEWLERYDQSYAARQAERLQEEKDWEGAI